MRPRSLRSKLLIGTILVIVLVMTAVMAVVDHHERAGIISEMERRGEALARSLTAENLAGELRYVQGAGRTSFERPYGLAWLLQLAAELREWDGDEARAWSRDLAPLEKEAAARLSSWLPKLANPIRIGEHSQTAFALGLVLDWARETVIGPGA